ncbi:nuclear transport factor 2 family protein [Paenibacillus motobuensis]|uniref:nuclear transport factor 2 family protein n=1 Tax=Paenibacillus TaxID=44249 RepID=UPI0020425D83|nr:MULTISPECIES: nuclear transport factor 2 family protein [Paenibacillus]MCM3041579.1 nuclear transport factor 2 family protein [Paenibacillus lutimineralis]MCM3648683.1 nuclear transport factor 2 family protein [Paenibacillus motobuensis]
MTFIHQNELVRKAVAVLESFESGNPEAITAYVHPDQYIQHNQALPDGREAMLGALDHLKEIGTKVNIKRTLVDGDYVVLHSVYDFHGPKIAFDIFHFENGLIVEHWDNLQEMEEKTPSNHTMIDGPVTIKDIDKTDANKVFVKSYVENILLGKNPDLLASYFDGDNYIQHSLYIADSLSGLHAALQALKEKNIEFQYTHVHQVIGQGDFVLTVSEGLFDGQHTAFYDLFRVEDGKIAEHWDVIEAILPTEQRKNSNSRF